VADRLLIVDDDAFIRELNQVFLESNGYQVEVAEDGEVAWEKIIAAPERYDLILLDKHMPRLDGIAFLKRLKAESRFKELPVIMLTGDGNQQDVMEGLSQGAYYYLTKPSTEVVLLQVVRNALEELYRKRNLHTDIGQRIHGLRSMRHAEFSISTLEDARNLAIVLADASCDPMRTVNGYSELLTNAVEHGNLGITYAEKGELVREGRLQEEIELRQSRAPYADRKVTAMLNRCGPAFIVTIIDEGEGFDWKDYLEFSPDRAFDLHGRGIAMSKAISFDDIRYVGKGNMVVTTVYSA